jgi:hypothetical protein
LHAACSDGIAYYYASDFGHIRYLITRAPEVLALLVDSSGRTPLHLLLSNEDLSKPGFVAIESSISFIFKANPKVLTVRDNKGVTLLLVASQFYLPLNVIYFMLRFEPQLNLSSSCTNELYYVVPQKRSF